MSLHFLIDGYNVIKQADSLRGIRALKDARMSLVKIIQANRIMRDKNNKVTIVFDGRDDFDLFPALAQNKGKGPIKIIFSKGESADETIKRIVDGYDNPRQVVVITDDKAIIFFTRSLGAKAMPVSEFLGEKQKQSDRKALRLKLGLGLGQRRQRNAELLKVELTHQQQETINQELSRIWK